MAERGGLWKSKRICRKAMKRRTRGGEDGANRGSVGEPGHAYVFLNYGVHHCLNVVAEKVGTPGCVLIRHVEGLGDGPGKVTRATGITIEQNGCDLTRGPIVIRRGKAPSSIVVTPRIGIRRSADLPLRFVACDD